MFYIENLKWWWFLIYIGLHLDIQCGLRLHFCKLNRIRNENIIKRLYCWAVVYVLAGLAQASEVLEGAMKSLAKNSKAFAQAKTATEANTALTSEMQKAAATASKTSPDSLVKQPKTVLKVKQYEQKFDHWRRNWNTLNIWYMLGNLQKPNKVQPSLRPLNARP